MKIVNIFNKEGKTLQQIMQVCFKEYYLGLGYFKN